MTRSIDSILGITMPVKKVCAFNARTQIDLLMEKAEDPVTTDVFFKTAMHSLQVHLVLQEIVDDTD